MVNTEIKVREYVENRIHKIDEELLRVKNFGIDESNDVSCHDVFIIKEELNRVLEILKGNYEI